MTTTTAEWNRKCPADTAGRGRDFFVSTQEPRVHVGPGLGCLLGLKTLHLREGPETVKEAHYRCGHWAQLYLSQVRLPRNSARGRDSGSRDLSGMCSEGKEVVGQGGEIAEFPHYTRKFEKNKSYARKDLTCYYRFRIFF